MTDEQRYAGRFPDVMLQLLEYGSSQMRVGMPGIIEKYTASEQSCDVQPAFLEEDGTELPVLTRVPVYFPRFGPFSISAPPAAGDPCWIGFSERDIDNWMNFGKKASPLSRRSFDWNDAVVWAGFSPFNDSLAVASATDLVIGLANSNMIIRVTPAGKIQIGNENTSVDLLAILDSVLSELMTTTVNTGIGPQPLNPTTVAALGTLRVDLTTIKGA